MLILLNLIEEGSHCVYLGYIVAVSLPLRNLDWILTFSSFRFIFPVQFSRCMLKNLADPSKRYSVSIKIPIRFLPSRAQQNSLSFCGICTTFSYFSFAEARPRIRSVIHKSFLPRKEVIQPHLPIRLPCYDFTPVIGLTFDGCALAVHSPASGAPNSHGVTGGVYKARERIHRGMLIRDY